ncbi:hypothetical protein HDV02_000680 [Globomyces sp. JEL0801]|nr:hypothetical protein HDV02_000680 [Globomyces sp. JEL0801]
MLLSRYFIKTRSFHSNKINLFINSTQLSLQKDPYSVLGVDKNATSTGGFNNGFNGFGGFGGNGFNGGGFSGNPFEDLFSQFGGAQRESVGSDISTRLQISFLDAAKGIEKEISYRPVVSCTPCKGSGAKPGTTPKTCPQCRGAGQVKLLLYLNLNDDSTKLNYLTTAIIFTKTFYCCQKPSLRWLNHQHLTFEIIESLYTPLKPSKNKSHFKECPSCGGKGTTIPSGSKCTSCSGQGRVREKKNITVKIPAGIDDGMTVRLSGQGDAAESPNGRKGDLLIQVNVTGVTYSIARHDRFKRDGANVLLDVNVPLITAILGGSITIPTIDGNVDLKIPPGTQPNDRKTLKNRGMPRINSRQKGDQWITLKVELPKSISTEQKELLMKAFGTPENAEQHSEGEDKGFFSKIFGKDKEQS